jgi:replicative DNA helicase
MFEMVSFGGNPDEAVDLSKSISRMAAIDTGIESAVSFKETISKRNADLETAIRDHMDSLATVSSYLGHRRVREVESAELATITQKEAIDLHSGAITQKKTYIDVVDSYIGGVPSSAMVVIGARPSVGKSIIGLYAAMRTAEAGHHVVYFTAEMEPEECHKRIAAFMSGTNVEDVEKTIAYGSMQRLVGDDEFKAYMDALESAKKLRITYFAISNMTPEDIDGAIARVTARSDVYSVYIDHMHRMTTIKSKPEREKFTEISSKLKSMALQYGIPFFVLAQLSRSNDKEKRMPELSDLRETGSIEQDADKVIMLHPIGDPTCNVINLLLLMRKNRQGSRFNAGYVFNKKKMTLTPMKSPEVMRCMEQKEPTATEEGESF